jgi:hypothetical protein
MKREGLVVAVAAFAIGLVLAGLVLALNNRASNEAVQVQSLTQAERALISSAQTLSTTWSDLGSVVGTEDAQNIALFAAVTISDSVNVRFRALGQHPSSTTEYTQMILTAAASSIAAEDRYVELNADADQDVAIVWELDRVYPLVQFQVQVSAVNTTAGQIDEAYAVIGR